MSRTIYALNNFLYLNYCFSLAVNDFGHADSKAAMMVNPGKSEVFIGQGRKFFYGLLWG
jgi:hypothetical protein